MRNFLSALLFYSFTFFGILSILIAISFYQNSQLKTPLGTKTLIFGDSHTQTSLNDGLMQNALNLSKSSEHLFFTKEMIKTILGNNSEVKTIIVGVSFHSFCANYDQVLVGKDANYFFSRYIHFYNMESLFTIAKRNCKVLTQVFRVLISKVFVFAKNQENVFKSGYYASKRSNLGDSATYAAISRHYLQPNNTLSELSNKQVHHFQEIVRLCKAKNVKLIVVNTPVHTTYRKKIPPKFVDHFYKVMLENAINFEFFDLHALKYKNECFGDGDHLNALGATLFTQEINKKIEKKL